MLQQVRKPIRWLIVCCASDFREQFLIAFQFSRGRRVHRLCFRFAVRQDFKICIRFSGFVQKHG